VKPIPRSARNVRRENCPQGQAAGDFDGMAFSVRQAFWPDSNVDLKGVNNLQHQ
jgi:hypothetical protein